MLLRLSGPRTDRPFIRSSYLSEDRICALLDEKEEQIWRLSSIHMKLDRFERAMRTLSEEDQSVLQICFMEQNTPEDAARKLGVEKSCLYKKRNRALARFSKALFGITDEMV